MSTTITTPKKTSDYRYNILSTLGTLPFDGRFLIEGVTFENTPCDLPDSLDLTLCPADPLQKAAPDTLEGWETPVLPQGVTAAFSCSPVGFTKQDAVDKATAILDRGRLGFVSNFWANELANDPGLSVNLAQPNPSCGLAFAQSLVAAVYGRAAVIYAPPPVASVWTEGHAVYEDSDGNLRTQLGNLIIVIPTASPPAAPPATPTTGYVYVRDSIPSVYVSAVSILSVEPDILAKRNDVRARVEQTFLIADDPCISFAVPIEWCNT